MKVKKFLMWKNLMMFSMVLSLQMVNGSEDIKAFDDMSPRDKRSYMIQVDAQRLHTDKVLPTTEALWDGAFTTKAPTNSVLWMDFFEDMTKLARQAMSYQTCLTNETCLLKLAAHLNDFQVIDLAPLMVEARQAFEADSRLNGTGSVMRTTGMRGRPGPNMRAWHVRHRRAQYWNNMVSTYRINVLTSLRVYLEQSHGKEMLNQSDSLLRLAKKANLTKSEKNCLGLVMDRQISETSVP